MKKQFIFILASIFTMLFAACSQENELDAPGGEKSNLVSVSTQLPTDFAKTRASVDGHQLRCILEVWTKESQKLIARYEKLAATTDEKISFTFEVEKGTYNCLMWADFVTNTTATEAGRYEDKYYTTTDMTKIKVIDVNALFNTEACDAFFGMQVLEKGDIAATLSTELIRPFAKLTIKEKEVASYAKCTNVKVGYKVPDVFNVKNGTVSGEADAAYNGGLAGNNVYFTHYILASKKGETLNNIAMTFTVDGKEIEKTIPSGVPTKGNYRTNASGSFIPVQQGDGEAKVDISFGNDWLDDNQDVTPGNPEAPAELAVGDFYYSDGSYSADLNSGKTCVGIVFAVGAQQGDAIGNYTGTGLTGEIKGYVLAAKEVMSTGTTKFYKDSKLELTGFENINETDFLGYTYTNILKTAYQAEVANSDEKTAKELFPFFTPLSGTRSGVAPEATSGWYLPSTGQLNLISQLYYTPATSSDGIIKTKLSALGEAGEMFANDPSNYKLNIYLSSTLTPEGAVYRTSFELKDGVYKTEKASTTNAGGRLRCILTF